MTRTTLTLMLLALPGLAAAQPDLRSGPNAPAVSSQLPPSNPPGNSFRGPEGPVLAPRLAPDDRSGASGATTGAPGTQSTDHIRAAPPADHQVLGGPPMPGAVRPDDSTGIFSTQSPIPPRPGAVPQAPTTDTGRR